jgi:membrane-bound ClpP family serine protease
MIRDLIWSDKSPAPLAIAINLALTQTPILIWINSWNDQETRGKAMLVVASLILTITLLSLVAQLILLLKIRNPSAWVTGTIAAFMFLPVLIMLNLSLSPDRYAGLWLFFGFPWLVIANITTNEIFLGFTGQISIIIALTLQLIYQLQRGRMRRTH